MRSLFRSLLARPSSSGTFAASYAKSHFHQPPKLPKTTTCLKCKLRPLSRLLWNQSRFYSSNADKNKPDTAPLGAQRTSDTTVLSNAQQSIADGESTSSSSSPLPPSPDELTNLPSQQEKRRSDTSKRFSKAMDDLQTAVFTAGQKLNVLTGYSDIESLKKSIEAQEEHVQHSRLEVRKAKEDYQSAINRRSASQREVNELLQRKHAWSSTDLERFTQLYRSDHTNEQAELAAQEQLAQAERTADDAQAQLARSILARYHEEQIWSDKIRRASTWGTWGLMGFNVLLFVVVQLGLEPWKRKRLVGGFEEKVREVIQEENLKYALFHADPTATRICVENMIPVSTETGATIMESSNNMLDPEAEGLVADVAVVSEQEPEAEAVRKSEFVAERVQLHAMEKRAQQSIDYVRERTRELLSEQEVVISQKELTAIAAKSAAVGAVLTGVVSLIISHR